MKFGKIPYYMTNTKWYYFDENEFKHKLTEEAPQKAIDSYNEHYKLLESRLLNN